MPESDSSPGALAAARPAATPPAAAAIAAAAAGREGQAPAGLDARGAARPASPTSEPPPLSSRPKPKSRGDGDRRGKLACRFFATKKGCRAGEACPFLHPSPQPNQDGSARPASPASPGPEPRNYQAPPVAPSLVAAKPVPVQQSLNPREFQLQQLRRRFSLTESSTADATSLTFKLTPSDPDFPFNLSALQCVLRVPADYPTRDAPPTLRVTNEEMGRGIQANVERGFTELMSSNPNEWSLLKMMNALDRRLEALLAGRPAATIKLVPNAGASSGLPSRPKAPDATPASTAGPSSSPKASRPAEPFDSPEERTAAAERRAAETRQLEARLGRLPRFAKAADGLAYTVPVTPARREDLPVPLQAVATIELFVPSLYPLLPCRARLHGVSREAARATESAFERRAREFAQLSLTGHVNYLSTNMHELAQQEPPPESGDGRPDLDSADMGEPDETVALSGEELGDRSHIRVIPRPPEWDAGHAGNAGSDSEIDSASDDTPEDSDNADEQPASTSQATGPPTTERGISVSFPSIELHGIELLELASLSLTIKCERCKAITDVEKVKHATSGPRHESCRKCASVLGIGFRREFVHANSTRAGYLDIEGCTVVDLLPSFFLPTCSECSTAFPAPGCTAVRGDNVAVSCRECHRKMNFRIPEVKFLLVSAVASRSGAPRSRKVRENLGITAGQPLPRHGRCEHYRKSFRWFRFGCCARVYACDRCHDAHERHPNEHAPRMICGHCSREQPYRPRDCARCGVDVTQKAGGGFWEGGKGTRDPVKMSRKDPRKYRRSRRPPGAGG